MSRRYNFTGRSKTRGIIVNHNIRISLLRLTKGHFPLREISGILRLLALVIPVCSIVAAEPTMEEAFKNPASSVRPLIWWRFMDDCVTREGITADLESMQRIGLGGGVVSYCSSNTEMSKPKPGLPVVPILANEWWSIVAFQLNEASRRNLDLWFQVCPGYATSGGPWITPEHSMQKLVWSEITCSGSKDFDATLPVPKVDKRWNYYRDVAVLAIPGGAAKAAVAPEQVVNLTDRMDASGRLKWNPPAGPWKIVRLGHTTTGVPTHPTTQTGGGLECDKLSREATRIQFDSYFKKILALRSAGATGKVELFFDSWEAQTENWTPRFREEFQKRRGYDPLPWLLTVAGKLIGSEELSRRFDYDWKTTIEEMINTEHFAELARLSRENGCPGFRAQPYNGPVNFMTAGALFDIPEGEFWHNKREYGWWSLRMIASVSHVNGKNVASAEALTALPGNHHMDMDPYSTKAETDLALTMGINSFAIHAMAHNPWPKLKPGMTTGFFPPLLGGWQVWNDLAGSWITYLSRCSYLLQQGTFAADVVKLFRPSQKGYELLEGYSSDLCNEELIVSSMTCDGSALSLPGGMRYRVLELVDTTKVLAPALSPSGIEKRSGGKMLPQNISLPLLRKVRALVQAGATVVGPRPLIAAGLAGYPACDKEVAGIADELWGPASVAGPIDRKVGKGRVFSGMTVIDVLARIGVQPDFKTVEAVPAADVPWIHRSLDDSDLYFVSNQKSERMKVTGSFRVDGRIPEFWHADTGLVEPARSWTRKEGRTEVELDFDPRGSVFVLFRQGTPPSLPVKLVDPIVTASIPLSDGWKLQFPPGMGAPSEVDFPKLVSWTARPEKGIRFYSGIAVYQRDADISSNLLSQGGKVVLNLGEVKNMARVTVNGTSFPELWKPPFTCDITTAVKPGANRISVEVANIWANRLVGDEQEKADVVWDTKRGHGGVDPLAAFPDWLLKGAPRPSPERRAFTTWNYVRKTQPLLPSGLLGPVSVVVFGN